MKNQQGFSLLELLTVIAIIGLLSAIGFFATTTVKSRARDAIRAADMDQIGKALDLYNNQTGAYPIVQPTPVCIDGSDIVSTTLATAGYTTSEYADPIFKDETHCYKYVTDPDGTSYAIQYYFETNSISEKGFHTAPF